MILQFAPPPFRVSSEDAAELGNAIIAKLPSHPNDAIAIAAAVFCDVATNIGMSDERIFDLIAITLESARAESR